MSNCSNCKSVYGTIFSCKKCLNKLDDYITKDCVQYLDVSDIPNETITNTNFSFQDIAKDVVKFRETATNNPVMKIFAQDPLIYDPILMTKANRVLVNIARNIVNDPQNPPPEGFVKRATIIATDGEVFVDVITYKDDPQGIALGLNNDRNIGYMNFYNNIVNTPSNPLNLPIYQVNSKLPTSSPYLSQDLFWNPNNININSLSTVPKGLKMPEQHVVFISNRTYTYPADEVNPPVTGGTATAYQLYPNIGGRKEIVQAVTQGWGWCGRRSSVYNNLPGYYVANNVIQKDGYSLVLRIVYLRYK